MSQPWNWKVVDAEIIFSESAEKFELSHEGGLLHVEKEVNRLDLADGHRVLLDDMPIRNHWYEKIDALGFIDGVPFFIGMRLDQYEQRVVVTGLKEALDDDNDPIRKDKDVIAFTANRDMVRAYRIAEGALVQVLENGDLVTYVGQA